MLSGGLHLCLDHFFTPIIGDWPMQLACQCNSILISKIGLQPSKMLFLLLVSYILLSLIVVLVLVPECMKMRIAYIL